MNSSEIASLNDRNFKSCDLIFFQSDKLTKSKIDMSHEKINPSMQRMMSFMTHVM
jgi:hypothetical protein